MQLKERLLNTGDFVDNEYLDKYIQLVIANQNTKAVSCKTNSHHIVPSYYYRQHNLPVDNSLENRVNLVYRDHMLAHLYLSGCTQGRSRYWNLYSIFMMSGQRYLSDDEFVFLKNLDDYQKLYEEATAAAPNHRKGTQISEETRKKMSDAQRGHEGTIKGKVWITRDGVNKVVCEEELNSFLSEGWSRGRHIILSDEAKTKMDAARRKPRSKEFCNRMREIASQQAPPSEEARKRQSEKMKSYYSQNPNPFKGRKHTQEALDKNRLAHLGKRYVNKDGVVKSITPEEVSEYLAAGWSLGYGVSRKRLV